MMKKVLITTIIFLGFTVQALAASGLLDYERRVARAAEQIERIRSDEDYKDEGIESIKTLVPRAEEVEIKGRIVNVNNTFLHVKLDLYASATDKSEKQKALDEASGYLNSLDKHLVDAADISREELKRAELEARLREVLSDDKYREKRDGPLTAFIKKVQTEIKELLQKIYRKLFGALVGASIEAGWLFKSIIIILIGAFLFLALRWILAYKRPAKKKKKRTVLGEEIEDDAKPSDLADAAMAAAKTGDFRTAMRKLYIAFLYELSEKGLIELEANATNWEYLRKVSNFATLAQPMRYLTDRFDYFWYGMFPSSEDDFSNYLAKYREAVGHAKAINPETAPATN